MTLTVKQRAKINAALCLIHDNGHDASAITAMARHMPITVMAKNGTTRIC